MSLFSNYTYARRAAAKAHPDRKFRQFQFAVTAALHGRAYADWARTCDTPALATFAGAHPLLRVKPLRAAYAVGVGVADRYRILNTSFGVMTGHPEVLRALCGSGLELARIDASSPDKPPFVLRLIINPGLRREGEFVAALTQGDTRIHQSAFYFDRDADGLSLRIGCSQGIAGNADAVSDFYAITHGIRPKSFLVLAAQWLAGAFGADSVLGAGNTVQFMVNNRHKWLWWVPGRARVTFDYDAFWLEHDGVLRPDGWFRLPLPPARRERSEIKANKRPQYARRYALYDRLAADIAKALAPDAA